MVKCPHMCRVVGLTAWCTFGPLFSCHCRLCGVWFMTSLHRVCPARGRLIPSPFRHTLSTRPTAPHTAQYNTRICSGLGPGVSFAHASGLRRQRLQALASRTRAAVPAICSGLRPGVSLAHALALRSFFASPACCGAQRREGEIVSSAGQLHIASATSERNPRGLSEQPQCFMRGHRVCVPSVTVLGESSGTLLMCLL